MTEDEMVGWRHQLNGHELSKLEEMVEAGEAWRVAVHGVAKSWTRLRDRTTWVCVLTGRTLRQTLSRIPYDLSSIRSQ